MLEKTFKKLTLDEAIKEKYPLLPEKSLPLALPITEYDGSFHHPAYRTFTFEVKPGTEFSHGKQYLEAIVTDRAWPFILRLFHVSGDYWLGYALNGIVEHEGQVVSAIRAIAKLAEDGTIKQWGLEVEPGQQRKNWIDKLIWFAKT